MKSRIILTLLASICIISCKKDDPAELIESTIYLDSWEGTYRGSAVFTTNDPNFNTDPVEVITTISYRDVIAIVSKTNIDSTLTIQLTFDDTLVVQLNEYQFSEQGVYNYSGVGSSGAGYGELDIQFEEDMMTYSSLFQSGSYTNDKIEFSIPKQCGN